MYEQTGTLIKNKFKEHLIPTILTAMALSMATVVDSIIVGRLLGSDALAAIGISTPVINLINIIYVIFGVGGMMCASVARGRWEMKKADTLFTTGLIGGTAVMTVLLAAVLLFLKPIALALSGGDAAAAALTADYLRALIFTGPFLMLSNGVALFMRADGKPNQSALIVIVANAVNLVLDFILIKYCKAGIMGAGLSTTLGYVSGSFVVLPYLLNLNGKRTFKFVRIKSCCKTALEIIKTGLPKGCTYIATFLRSMCLNSIVIMSLGTGGMTILTVLLNVLTVAAIFVSGTGDTLLPIVGTLYGEKDIFGIRKTIDSARNILICAVLFLVIVFCTCSDIIGFLFGLSAASELAALKSALRMFALYIPFYAACTTLQNFYNITERRSFATLIAIFDGFIFVCLSALVLSSVNAGLLWLCYFCGSFLTFILILVFGAFVRRKEKVKGILLLKEIPENEKIWNMTIDATCESAVGLSQAVMEFCSENGVDQRLASRLGIGIEEMTMAAVTHAHSENLGKIDIMIRLGGDEIVLRFRDNGKAFDVTGYKSESSEAVVTDGIELLKLAAKDISYSSQLGFNITAITFDWRNE